MRQTIKILFKYRWEGLRSSLKLLMGRISFLKFKNDKSIVIYIPKYKQSIYLRRHTSDYSTFKQIFVRNEYEVDFDFIPNVIVDAGANIGLAAVYFSNRYPSAKIYSIEPEESNLSILEDNLSLYLNVKKLPFALHHSAGFSLEVLDYGLGNYGFITKEKSQVSDSSKVLKTVDTISIEELMRNNHIDIIDICKIDIEGAEKPLFEKNYEYWLPRTRCVIVEFHDRWYPGCKDTVMKAINNYDFTFYIKGENYIFLNNSL
ncbi:MAG: FkbM family methyltransferase [Psychroserpens sp.]|uniref:FkbM family methyltransferase n=1 Tax=Psychroserpens sp. TaxID=2020870 RepID=UPI003C9296A6